MNDNVWHALRLDEALKALDTSVEGLNSDAVEARRVQSGDNKIDSRKKVSVFTVILTQFMSPLVYILLAAAAVKFILGSYLDGLVILAVLFLMAAIGTFQELKAESAMSALLSMVTQKAKIKRNGLVMELEARLLVPGDIVILDAGDKVPADIRILNCQGLKANEASLTGESVPVEKFPVVLEKATELAERKNMLFMGTAIAAGHAEGVVVMTGMHTEVGKIAQAIKDVKPEKTPLQRSIHSLGNYLIIVAGCACVLLFVSGIARSISFRDIFLLTVAASVSAIPEGLPGVITVLLAKGMQTMAKGKAIVRRMTAVETLGSCTVICTDKTGTLTKNEMTVREILLKGKKISVSGDGYSSHGELKENGKPVSLDDYALSMLFKAGILCSDAVYDIVAKAIIGDPTEGALLVAATKAGFDTGILRKEFPRIDGLPFSSEKKYMASVHKLAGKSYVFIKGAPEKILPFCSHVLFSGEKRVFEQADREYFIAENMRMASSALRVIAFGFRECDKDVCLQAKDVEHGMTFVGLAAMMDPPRIEAAEAITKAYAAGIRVSMITGDNENTARAIAQLVGMDKKDALSGVELRTLSEEELARKIHDINVFYRVEPLDKLKIVRAYAVKGDITAMTGDGVNDAPALEAADIGISMGITGTDVAKEASDMLLADDNFATIISAVEEGRSIFERLRNVVMFLLSTCFGELLSLITTVALIGQAPLLPLQILWVNLVTGTIMAVPLGLEPKTGNQLLSAPRNPKVGLIFTGMIARIALMAVFVAVGVSVVFYSTLKVYGLAQARSSAFFALVALEWILAFNARSDTLTVFSLGILRNRYFVYALFVAFMLQLAVIYIGPLEQVFGTVSLSPAGLLYALIPAGTVFLFETLRKIFWPDLFSKGKYQPGV